MGVGPRKAAQPQPVQCSAPPPKSFLGEQLSNFLDFENFEVSTQGATMSNEFSYACDKCPRTFKMEEFFEKHKKVHDLKKQHKCDICGFVYGAAKGLEGHIKTHTDEEIAAAHQANQLKIQQNGSRSPNFASMDFQFLN